MLTRKTLDGLYTNLHSQALGKTVEPIVSLCAVGEGAGGGCHGCNALEGAFPGGCIFSGQSAGRHAAE